jgi:plasmid stabilization system protein ParE
VEISIVWSELAERQLNGVFYYYSFEASAKIARKIIHRILDRVSILESDPLVGQKEELLREYPEDYRYLVENNYKIIYWQKGNLITIASVFDCRQNPESVKII